MPSTSIVVDLGFGDAGKGTIVDALARRCSSPPLVVRHNGGAQAGHNVHTSDGRHHTFSQFGAATFVPGARTLLSQHMILHPTGLMAENEGLISVGVRDALQRLLIDSRALVITPFHQAANRLRELARGEDRHGTCGVGVGETVAYALEHDKDSVRVADLVNPDVLRKKLALCRAWKRHQLYPLLRTIDKNDPNLLVLEDPAVVGEAVAAFLEIGRSLKIIDAGDADNQLKMTEHVIFEGAQGVLLDEWHGFHPHTTWSTTTTRNADEMLVAAGREGPVRRLGVVRAYATRHGQGPFPTEDAQLSKLLPDSHNTPGGWQGDFRVGWFDAVLTRYALSVCPGISEIAVTCLDRVRDLPEWKICKGYEVPAESRERFQIDPVHGVLAVGIKPNHTRDLGYQMQLAKDLTSSMAVLWPIKSAGGVLREIEESLSVPVTMVSIGPTAEHKYETHE